MNDPLDIQLRPTIMTDLESLFLFQQDKEACYLAAFTPANHTDQEAYMAKFTRLLLDPTVHNRSIFVDDILVGSIAKFEINGEAEITYWLGRAYWGRGIATRALAAFLALEPARPMSARIAYDNYPSQKVLEKAGFVKVGTDKGFANARQQETEEWIYKLM